MKVINQSRVALMKTFYNFVVLPNKQRHNISESVSLIPVPKSGKFQTCAGRATTLVTVLLYPLISHIRCGVLFIHPHIGFSRTSEQMNGQTPHFRVFIILIQQRSRTKRMKAIMTISKDHVTEKPRRGASKPLPKRASQSPTSGRGHGIFCNSLIIR